MIALPSRPQRRAIVLLFALSVVMLGFSGCGSLHANAQGGSGMKPRFGTSVSVPLGK